MDLKPISKDDLFALYTVLNERFNNIYADLNKHFDERSTNSVITRNFINEDPEPDIFNPESSVNKKRRNLEFQALMEYFLKCENELEQISQKLKKQLVEDFQLQEIRDKEVLAEQTRHKQFTHFEELDKQKALIRLQLEQLLEKLNDLVKRNAIAQQEITFQIGKLISGIVTQLASATEVVFADFQIPTNANNIENIDIAILNEIINNNRPEFQQLGAGFDEQVLREPNVNFNVIQENLNQNFRNLLDERIRIENRGHEFNDLDVAIDNASVAFSNSLLDANPQFENNITNNLNMLTIMRTMYSKLQTEMSTLNFEIETVTEFTSDLTTNKNISINYDITSKTINDYNNILHSIAGGLSGNLDQEPASNLNLPPSFNSSEIPYEKENLDRPTGLSSTVDSNLSLKTPEEANSAKENSQENFTGLEEDKNQKTQSADLRQSSNNEVKHHTEKNEMLDEKDEKGNVNENQITQTLDEKINRNEDLTPLVSLSSRDQFRMKMAMLEAEDEIDEPEYLQGFNFGLPFANDEKESKYGKRDSKVTGHSIFKTKTPERRENAKEDVKEENKYAPDQSGPRQKT